MDEWLYHMADVML